MTALCGLSKTYWQLFLMRVGVGVGEATLSPAAYSMIADYFPPRKLGKAIGVYAMGLYGGAGLAMLAGSAVVALVSEAGPISVPLLGTLYPWQLTFFAVALPGIFVLLLMATVKEPPRRELLADGSAKITKPAPVPLREVFSFMSAHRKIIIGHFGGFLAIGIVVSAYLVWVPEFLRRSYGFSVAEGGFIYGTVLLLFGTSGAYSGGWLSEKLADRGFKDAEMRAALIGGCTILPLAVLAPLAPEKISGVFMLTLVSFVLSFPQGLAPTILQLVAPNRMRAQLTAVFMFIGVLAGYTIGPAAVALMTDYLFKDESALRYSLSIVSAVFVPMGIAFLWYGMKPFGQRSSTR